MPARPLVQMFLVLFSCWFVTSSNLPGQWSVVTSIILYGRILVTL